MRSQEVKIKVAREPLGLRVPVGLYNDMVQVIDAEKRWSGRQEFVLEAIKEKIDRHRKENPFGAKR